jgi:hypothetical protein
MNTAEDPPQTVRPYFLPEAVDFNALPASIQAAFTTIINPAYRELVLAAPNALERSMGASFVFLLAEEVLNHFEIGKQMDLAQTQNATDGDARQKALGRYLKLLGAKNAALNALMRLRRLPPFPRFTPNMSPMTQV